MKHSIHRRHFIKQTAAAATGAWLVGLRSRIHARSLSPNEKLNIGMVGVANRAGEDLKEVSSENIVALCDIDDQFLAAAKQKYPQAKTYNDFRRLLDQKDIDAVVVGTPDHTHAVAAVAALRSGRHVYCEKPLARTISETRIITEAAQKHKRVTQIGTQITPAPIIVAWLNWCRAGRSGRCARCTCGSPRLTGAWICLGKLHPCLRTFITICGWGPLITGRIARNICRSDGATGGRLEEGLWPISAVTTWICRIGRWN